MPQVTARSDALRQLLASHRVAVDAVLARYAATSPRLFGSVARGEAGASSDVDLLVDWTWSPEKAIRFFGLRGSVRS